MFKWLTLRDRCIAMAEPQAHRRARQSIEHLFVIANRRKLRSMSVGDQEVNISLNGAFGVNDCLCPWNAAENSFFLCSFC